MTCLLGKEHGIHCDITPFIATCPLAASYWSTGEPMSHCERARPCELIHIDVKKLGHTPDSDVTTFSLQHT
ncbi:hypothetical protein SUDANB66_06501 (plasmid) [Streptomyces sp. SudanB66_2053]